MSNPDKVVMQQALDALLGYKPQSLTHAKEQGSAIIALRAAIAQPANPVQTIDVTDADMMPPLPENATHAYVQGNARQGPEIRLLSSSYEPDCAMFTPKQMHAYAKRYAVAFAASKASQTVEPDTVLRSDFDSVAADRERAKKLILKIDQALADAGLPADAPARTLIAENTGRWFEFPAVAQTAAPVAQPVVTFDGMSAQELIGNELFEFQEATGFDTAAEYRAAIAQPVPPAKGADKC